MTTYPAVLEKVFELVGNATRSERIQKYVKAVENSGFVDVESYEDNYLLPKIIASAIFAELSYQLAPLGSKKDKALAKELQQYVL